MTNADYKELSDLLGKPAKLETGFLLGGQMLRNVIDSRGVHTGYSIGGPRGDSLIDTKGREIARLGGFLGNDFIAEGKPTGYFLSVDPGKRRILYSPNKDEFLR